MNVTYLQWQRFYDNDGERNYVVRRPSWQKICAVFYRLDGQAHPSFYLQFHENIRKYPQLIVIGGKRGYAMSLLLGNEIGEFTKERCTYVDTTKEQDPEISKQFREIGKGYHNYEIDEKYFLDNREQAITLIQHISLTSKWPPDIPCRDVSM